MTRQTRVKNRSAKKMFRVRHVRANNDNTGDDDDGATGDKATRAVRNVEGGGV